jgi:hypothetical protein
MYKAFLLPVLISIGAAYPSLSRHDQFIENPKSPAQSKPHLIAFFGDIFGEGALKKDCVALWRGSGYPDIDQRKCDKASAEIEFAKLEYPKILSLTKSIKSNDDASRDFATQFNQINVLKQKCIDQTATRAAKTARYWGTTEVGSTPDVKNVVITTLSNLNASEYGLILEACKQNSWLDEKFESLQNSLKIQITDIESASKKTPPACNVATANQFKNSIDNAYINKIKEQSRQSKSLLKALDTFESSTSTFASAEDSTIPKSTLYSTRVNIKNTLKACASALAVSQQYLAENLSAQKERERVQRQAAMERARVQRQLANQRREQKAFDDAMNSVTLD